MRLAESTAFTCPAEPAAMFDNTQHASLRKTLEGEVISSLRELMAFALITI
jgi:hypothetical protein